MALDITDPTTFIVPLSQVLLYSADGVIYYKRFTGTINTISSTNILLALGLLVSALPSLVYLADLLRCLNTNIYLTADATVATSAKAYKLYVEKETNKKLDKTTYLEDKLVVDEKLKLAHTHANKLSLDLLSILNNKLLINGVDTSSITAFLVLAHTVDIARGTDTTYLGTPLNPATIKVAITNNTVLSFFLRCNKTIDKQDVIIDWGDGTVSDLRLGTEDPYCYYVSLLSSSGEVVFYMKHDYKPYLDTNSLTFSKFIIKFYGQAYFGFKYSNATITDKLGTQVSDLSGNNLICRVLDLDLPIALHISNLASFCYSAQRLLKVALPKFSSMLRNITNYSSTFALCRNLQSATGFYTNTCLTAPTSSMFTQCINMTLADMTIPKFSTVISNMYYNCVQLKTNIYDILPAGGFGSLSMNFAGVFYSCRSLQGVNLSLGNYLWRRTDIAWSGVSTAFADPNGIAQNYNTIAQYIPIAWGGTSLLIIPEYKSIALEDLNFLSSTIQGALTELKQAANITILDPDQLFLSSTVEGALSLIKYGILTMHYAASSVDISELNSDGLIVLPASTIPVLIKTNLGSIYNIQSSSVTYLNGVFKINPAPYIAYDNSAAFAGTWTIYITGTYGDSVFTQPLRSAGTSGIAMAPTQDGPDYLAFLTGKGANSDRGTALYLFNLKHKGNEALTTTSYAASFRLRAGDSLTGLFIDLVGKLQTRLLLWNNKSILVPTGTIIQVVRDWTILLNNSVAGFLRCNGNYAKVLYYLDLYNALGTAYGFNQLQQAFRLPDLTGQLSGNIRYYIKY